MSKLWAERLTALGMIAFAAIFLVQAMRFPFTSGDFPKFTEYVIILLAVVMLVRSFLTKDQRFGGDVELDFSYMGLKPTLIMIVAIFYAYAVFRVGFYVTSIVFYFLVTYMTGYKNLKIMSMVAVVLFPVMYIFFTILLAADLPEGFLI